MAVFKHLKSIFCKKKPCLPVEVTSASIQKLPAELLYDIANQLSSSDAAAFALSSKAILNVVGHQVLRIRNLEDRVELLKHLEIFFPKHVLCYQCGKFHCRRRRGYRTGNTKCDRQNGRLFHGISALNLSFTRVQEVMNRHRYGKQHGVSVRSLNKSRSLSIGTSDHKSEWVRAKIFRNQLFIKVTISVWCEDRDRDFNRECQYCPHQASWNLELRQHDYIHHKVMRCLECFTEVRFDKFGNSRPFTTMWYNLGYCRSPFEDEWRSLTSSTGSQFRRFIPPGEARYMHLL